MELTVVDSVSCDHYSNVSCFGLQTLTDAVLYMSVAAMFFLTICGNLIVIISICHFKQLHTPTNIILLSLATADFLIGVIVMPVHFIMLIDPDRWFNSVYCIITNLASFYLTFISIYNVVFIAVDRYFALCNPFFYSSKMTVKLTLRIISILWLYSLLYNGILLYYNGGITDIKANVTFSECIITVNEIWAIADFVTVCILPCAIIIILYLKIFAIARKHVNAIRRIRKQRSSNDIKMASERKAAKTLGILVAMFLLCVIPYFICSFIGIYISTPSMYLALLGTSIIFALSSSINPIIYALFYTWFRRFLKLIVPLMIYGSGSSILNLLVK